MFDNKKVMNQRTIMIMKIPIITISTLFYTISNYYDYWTED